MLNDKKAAADFSAAAFSISEPDNVVYLGHVAAGIGILDAHEEVELVDPFAGARAAVFDKRDLKTDGEIHDDVADDAAAAAGGYREQTVLAGKAVGFQRLGYRADLVGLENEAVDAAELIRLADALGIGDGEVIGDDEGAGDLLMSLDEAVPVVLVEHIVRDFAEQFGIPPEPDYLIRIGARGFGECGLFVYFLFYFLSYKELINL